jgi:hypothetical protein
MLVHQPGEQRLIRFANVNPRTQVSNSIARGPVHAPVEQPLSQNENERRKHGWRAIPEQTGLDVGGADIQQPGDQADTCVEYKDPAH